MTKVSWGSACVYLCVVTFFVTTLESFTTHHFYRASYMPTEPRFETGLLGALDIQLAGGSAHKGRNKHGDSTDLISVLAGNPGSELFHKSPTRFFHDCCSRFTEFHLFETNITFTQNICYGFFLQAYIPVRLMQFNSFLHRPACVTDQVARIVNTKHHHLLTQTNTGGLADSVFLLGWTKNYVYTDYVDFIDATLETGLLTPTGRLRKRCNIFDIPFGYNGHFAIPLTLDVSTGALNWLTFGTHADALFFFKRTQALCIDQRRTANRISVHPGILWSLGGYVKADHFARGLSCCLGVSYVQNQAAKLFPLCIAKSLARFRLKSTDPILRKWSMTTLNLLVDYDFAGTINCLGPRVAFFYNWQATGRRVFKTNMIGGCLGSEIEWRF